MKIANMRRVKIKNFKDIYLDLGCGDKKHRRPIKGKNNVGLDIIDYGQEIVWDIKDGIPLPDNSCEYIIASHFMEHFRKEDFIKIMNECWRILKPDGELYIIVPHRDRGASAWPVHLLEPSEDTFKFFDQTDETAREHRIKGWKIIEIITNEKKDIHVKMQPKKEI